MKTFKTFKNGETFKIHKTEYVVEAFEVFDHPRDVFVMSRRKLHPVRIYAFKITDGVKAEFETPFNLHYNGNIQPMFF